MPHLETAISSANMLVGRENKQETSRLEGMREKRTREKGREMLGASQPGID